MPVYPSIYRARAVSATPTKITAFVPQVFGTEPVEITEFLGPPAQGMGWVFFQAGNAEHPVWTTQVEGAGVDEVWVGPDLPPGAQELWYDTLSGPGLPTAADGVEGDYYVDTTSRVVYGPKVATGWSDDFERAGPAIGPNWVVARPGTGSGTIQPFTIATGAAVAPVDSGSAVMYWSDPQEADQAIEIEVENVFGNNGFFWLYTNMSAVDSRRLFCDINFYDRSFPWTPPATEEDVLAIDFAYHTGVSGTSAWSTGVELPYPTSEPITLRFESDADGSLRAYVNGTLVLSETTPVIVVGDYVGIGMNPDSYVGAYDSPRILRASGGAGGGAEAWPVTNGPGPLKVKVDGTWVLTDGDYGPAITALDGRVDTLESADVALDARLDVLEALPHTQVQVYSTPGNYTWTKPAGAVKVTVEVVSGGGAGGTGRRGATNTDRYGGTAGAGGGVSIVECVPSDLPATVNVTVGAGGVGGAPVTVNDTNGNPGTNGGDSYFGPSATAPIVSSTGGGGGPGGAAVAGTFTVTGKGMFAGGGSQAAGVGQQTFTNPVFNAFTPQGCAGSGLNGTTFQYPGGNGGVCGSLGLTTPPAGGAAGSGGAGGNGGNGFTVGRYSSTGGAGGGSSTTGNGGNGGNGGRGAGGGGGAASLNGFATGRGGNGGDGIVIVTTYF